MIRVALACLLLQSALAAPASLPRAAAADLMPLGHAGLLRDDAPGELLVRTLWKFKRNAPSEDSRSDHVSRRQFVIKFLCRKEDKCMHSEVYEFDLLGVQPAAGGNGVYY